MKVLPLVDLSLQLTPKAALFWATWLALISVNVLIGSRPEFSAKAKGTASRASAKARNAYCSIVLILSASLLQYRNEKKNRYFFKIRRIKLKYLWIPNCQGTWDLRGSTTIYNTVITNQITNCTQSIVHTSFGFIDNLKFKINFLVKINLDEFPTIILKFFSAIQLLCVFMVFHWIDRL